jgi:predicted dehydrogenase
VGSADWFSRFEQSGGVILDLLIHDFDTVRWCFGDFERIYAMRPVANGKDLHHDYSLTLARLKSGALVHMEGSWAEVKGTFYTYYEVAGCRQFHRSCYSRKSRYR